MIQIELPSFVFKGFLEIAVRAIVFKYWHVDLGSFQSADASTGQRQKIKTTGRCLAEPRMGNSLFFLPDHDDPLITKRFGDDGPDYWSMSVSIMRSSRGSDAWFPKLSPFRDKMYELMDKHVQEAQ